MFALAQLLARTWAIFLIFMIGITWPLMWIGGPDNFYLDTFHALWVRISYFVIGMLLWAFPVMMFIKWVSVDVFGSTEATARRAEIVGEIFYTGFAIVFILRMLAHG